MNSKRVLFTLGLLLAATYGFAQTGITNSAHDFSGETWTSNGEICVTCHTPHAADVSVAETPLWNHEVTTQDFSTQLYSSNTLNSTMQVPDGVSKLCLSCHDGTVALDNFGGNTGGTVLISAINGGRAVVGGTANGLTSEHPVSFAYDDALASADGGLHAPTSTASGLPQAGTIDTDMLFGGNVECASCHDVHNSYNQPMLLVKSNTGSALCLTCHNK